MNPIPLPAPFGGINEQVPKIALESPQCENLYQFNVTRQGVSLRHGDSKYRLIENMSGLTSQIPLRLFQYGDMELFALILDDTADKLIVFDVDNNVVLDNVAETAATYIYYYDSLFNHYLFFFSPQGGATPGFTYNGTVIASIGYTGSGFSPLGAAVFNSRHYIIQADEAAYWYSGIDAITGALTKIDLSAIVSQETMLSGIVPISLAPGNGTPLNLLAFIFSDGEVLFYTGTYPDSESWRIVGTAKIGNPIGINTYVAYQGDALLFCDNGVVSVRDLFLQGSEAAQALTVNKNIQDTWINLVRGIRTALSTPSGPIYEPQIKGVYDSNNNRIIISFPYYLDGDGVAFKGSFYFIYNTIEQAWSFHKSEGLSSDKSIIDIVYYQNKVLTLTQQSTSKTMVYEKEGSDEFTDRTADDLGEQGITFDLISAPIANGRAYVQMAQGLDVILQTDMYGETEYTFIQDFGVSETEPQLTSAPSGTLQKPFVNMGIEGSYIQYRIHGTTVEDKTVGIELYGVNVWIEQGNSPR